MTCDRNVFGFITMIESIHIVFGIVKLICDLRLSDDKLRNRKKKKEKRKMLSQFFNHLILEIYILKVYRLHEIS